MVAKKNKGYKVQPGDSLFKIAQELYGDQRMAYELAKANGGVINLKAGMSLKVPRKIKKPFIPNAWASAVGMATSGEYADWAKSQGGAPNTKMPSVFTGYNEGYGGPTGLKGPGPGGPVAETGRYGPSGMTVGGGAEQADTQGAQGGLGGPSGSNPQKAPIGYGNNTEAPRGNRAGGFQSPEGQFTGQTGGAQAGYTTPQPAPSPNGVAPLQAPPAGPRRIPGNRPVGAFTGTGNQAYKSAQADAQRQQQQQAEAARQKAQEEAKQEAAILPPGSTTYTGTTLPSTPKAVRSAFSKGERPYVVSATNANEALGAYDPTVVQAAMEASGYVYNDFGNYYVYVGSPATTGRTSSPEITPGSIAANTPGWLPTNYAEPYGYDRQRRARTSSGGGITITPRIVSTGVIEGNTDWRVSTG